MDGCCRTCLAGARAAAAAAGGGLQQYVFFLICFHQVSGCSACLQNSHEPGWQYRFWPHTVLHPQAHDSQRGMGLARVNQSGLVFNPFRPHDKGLVCSHAASLTCSNETARHRHARSPRESQLTRVPSPTGHAQIFTRVFSACGTLFDRLWKSLSPAYVCQQCPIEPGSMAHCETFSERRQSRC